MFEKSIKSSPFGIFSLVTKNFAVVESFQITSALSLK